MTTGKAMIFLGGAGFFVCLGVLLHSQELGKSVGSKMDLVQEANLISADIAPLKARVRESQIIINIPENALFFAFDDSSLTAEAQDKLRLISRSIIERYKEYKVRVVGHTDSQGDAAYNRILGKRRADAVAVFLVGSGLEARQIQGISMGKDSPLASNNSVEGRALNRRVEVNILPLVKRKTSTEETGSERTPPEDGPDDTRRKSNPVIEALQKHPIFIILGCLSSCITVAGGLSELYSYSRRRRIGAA